MLDTSFLWYGCARTIRALSLAILVSRIVSRRTSPCPRRSCSSLSSESRALPAARHASMNILEKPVPIAVNGTAVSLPITARHGVCATVWQSTLRSVLAGGAPYRAAPAKAESKATSSATSAATPTAVVVSSRFVMRQATSTGSMRHPPVFDTSRRNEKCEACSYDLRGAKRRHVPWAGFPRR